MTKVKVDPKTGMVVSVKPQHIVQLLSTPDLSKIRVNVVNTGKQTISIEDLKVFAQEIGKTIVEELKNAQLSIPAFSTVPSSFGSDSNSDIPPLTINIDESVIDVNSINETSKLKSFTKIGRDESEIDSSISKASSKLKNLKKKRSTRKKNVK